MESAPVRMARRQRIQLQKMCESPVGIPVISLLLSMLVISIMALLFGVQPWAVLVALFEGGLKGKYALSSTIHETVPLVLAGLAVFLPLRAGFFNIGSQGQLEIGALVAMVVVLGMQGSPVRVISLALLAAMAAGMLAVTIPLFLKISRGTSEVTTTIMVNFACIQFIHAMFTGPMKDPKAWYGTTHAVPAGYALPAFLIGGMKIHVGVLVPILLAVGVYWLMRRTSYGIELSAVGYKRTVAQAAGISVNWVISIAVLGAAAIAGLAGGIQALGVAFRVAEGWSKGWGFTGISVAFLAGKNPLAIVPIAFVFAILETGARYMQFMTGVPAALVYVFKGMPVLVYIALNARRVLQPKRVEPLAASE